MLGRATGSVRVKQGRCCSAGAGCDHCRIPCLGLSADRPSPDGVTARGGRGLSPRPSQVRSAAGHVLGQRVPHRDRRRPGMAPSGIPANGRRDPGCSPRHEDPVDLPCRSVGSVRERCSCRYHGDQVSGPVPRPAPPAGQALDAGGGDRRRPIRAHHPVPDAQLAGSPQLCPHALSLLPGTDTGG